MVIGPEWMDVEVGVLEVDEPQALKPARMKANAPTKYRNLSMYGIKQRFGKAASFLTVQSNTFTSDRKALQ